MIITPLSTIFEFYLISSVLLVFQQFYSIFISDNFQVGINLVSEDFICKELFRLKQKYRFTRHSSMSITYVAIDLNKKINFILSIYLKRFQTIIEEQWHKICWQLESNKYNVLYQNFAKSRVYKLGESYLIKNNSISNVIMFVPQRGYYRLINWLIFGV